MFFGVERNLTTAARRIASVLRKLGLSLKREIKDNRVTFSGTINTFDKDVIIVISYNAANDGSMYVSFLLDKIPFNAKTLEVLNRYNENSIYWRAYVDSDDNDINFDCDLPRVRVKDVKYCLREVLEAFVDDEGEKCFKELSAIRN